MVAEPEMLIVLDGVAERLYQKQDRRFWAVLGVHIIWTSTRRPDESGARSAYDWVAKGFGMSDFDYRAVLMKLWVQVCEPKGERISSLILDGVSLRPMKIEQMNTDIISRMQALGMVVDPELISGCTWRRVLPTACDMGFSSWEEHTILSSKNKDGAQRVNWMPIRYAADFYMTQHL